MTSAAPPSDWFQRHLPTVRRSARLGPALDLACGRGRHLRALAAAGHPVVGADRDRAALVELASNTPAPLVLADLEAESGLPFGEGRFGAVLVFRFLHRDGASRLEALLAPGGVLLYETFTKQQRTLGWGPRRDDFLLESGELPGLFPGLEVVAYEEGLTGGEAPAAVGSLLARRPA